LVLVLLQVSAGVALLFFGMQMMKTGLESAAKHRMKNFLRICTRNSFLGLLTGIAITALVQSSTAVTVLSIGFVNAGIITFTQALGIVLGTNIGTCVTTQLISFDLVSLAIPAIGLGSLLMILSKRKGLRSLGQSIVGFGVIFLGMNIISISLEPLKDSKTFLSLLTSFSNPAIGILAGTVFSALIHSSSTTTAVVIALSQQNLIDLPSSVAIVLGSNIGTCITGILVAIGTTSAAKRVAMAHVLLNVIGALVFIPFIQPFSEFIASTSELLPRQVANAHLVFNVISSIVVIPFISQFSKLLYLLVPDK